MSGHRPRCVLAQPHLLCPGVYVSVNPSSSASLLFFTWARALFEDTDKLEAPFALSPKPCNFRGSTGTETSVPRRCDGVLRFTVIRGGRLSISRRGGHVSRGTRRRGCVVVCTEPPRLLYRNHFPRAPPKLESRALLADTRAALLGLIVSRVIVVGTLRSLWLLSDRFFRSRSLISKNLAIAVFATCLRMFDSSRGTTAMNQLLSYQ